MLVTHSRRDSPEETGYKVRHACDWIAASGAKLCYKKIDSTLKGNLGSELEAIQNKFPDRLILVSPSFPDMERVLLDGWLSVRSSEVTGPIHLLPLLKDRGAGRLAHIQRLAGAGANNTLVERTQQTEMARARIIVIDAVSKSHLQAIAEAAGQIVPQPLSVDLRDWRLPGVSACGRHEKERPARAAEPGSPGPHASTVSADGSAAGPLVLCLGSTNPVT